MQFFYYLIEDGTKFPFVFIGTYKKDTDQIECPLQYGLMEFQDKVQDQLKFLNFIEKQKTSSSFMKKFIDSGEFFHPIGLTEEEATVFIEEVPEYKKLGITCRLPKWKKDIKIDFPVQKPKDEGISSIDIFDFNPKLFIEDVELTDEELERFVEQSSCLLKVKNKWVYADKKQLSLAKKTIDKMKKAKTVEEVQEIKEEVKEQSEVAIKEKVWNMMVLEHLKTFQNIPRLDSSGLTNCTLYDYQEESANLLINTHNLGLGMCLSMECGCGKTLITIAMLNYLKRCGKLGKTIIIMPVSLLGNWQKEVEYFAPELKVCIEHSSFKKKNAADYDLLLTTYTTITRRENLLNKHWDNIILDEAQAIKNPKIKQTKLIKAMKSNWKLAITATPLENSLEDTWSIMDFINPNVFGDFKDFKKLSTNKEKLKEFLNFFIIRKKKEDVLDLPSVNKIEVKVPMSRQQMELYNKILSNIQDKEIKVLPALIKLRQICNHPSQLTGNGGYDFRESGKFLEIIRICKQIHEADEKVLIFTQFTEVIPAVYALVKSIFNKDGEILTGQTSSKSRKEMIEKFQKGNYPFMILSIRAGGVGINLTAANNIIFLDEPYNPSIKYQAENRVHRIGQQKDVTIYTLITEGTIEESIHTILLEKEKLFNDVIPSDIKTVEKEVVQQLCSLLVA